MSIIVIAVATESGVPIFSRKRGTTENKCLIFSDYSVTLIGIATGGLECDLELLLSCVHNTMIFCIGKKELETLKNIDQVKRDLRQCYGILDYLLESLDPNVSSPQPTLILDLIQSVLCPQAQHIHGHLIATSSDFHELDAREARLLLLLAAAQDGAPLRDTPVYLPQMSPNYHGHRISTNSDFHELDAREARLLLLLAAAQDGAPLRDTPVYLPQMSPNYHGHLIATSSDFHELDAREARLLLLLAAAQDGAPLRDTPVYLPQMSPNVAFRAVTCKLLADVYILVVCGATPALSQIDEIVLQCWEGYAQLIKEAKLIYPRNFPMSLTFEPCVLGILTINIGKRRCVFSRHLHAPTQKGRMSGAHKMDILRTFYVTLARDLGLELRNSADDKGILHSRLLSLCH
ncbi:Protein fuzzy-like protein, partial [Operophtera brumata]